MPRFLTDREIAYIHAAELARKPMAMSEALGNQQGKTLKLLQYDRMRTDPFDESQRGGPWFSWLQKVHPEYENVAAAFTKKSGAKAKAKESGEDVVWAPFLGAREQHKSNLPMFNKFMDEFDQQLALGNVSPELLAIINKRIGTMPKLPGKKTQPFDPEREYDIADPRFRELVDTYDRRGAIAEMLRGKGVGGPTKGRTVNVEDLLAKHLEPSAADVDNWSIGDRLVKLDKTIGHRPDLHQAYPWVNYGEDVGVKYKHAPAEIVLRDFNQNIRDKLKREPMQIDWRTMSPSQFIDEDYLKYLQQRGYKAGGMISSQPEEAISNTIRDPGAAKMLNMDLAKLALMKQQPKRMAQGGAIHMEHGGITPRAFSYSPTDRDEHNRKLGLPAEFYRAGQTDPTMQSYGAGVSVPVGGARLTADAIGSRNAQMRDTLAGIMLGAEFPVGEGTLRAETMRPTMQGASPQYGVRYSRSFAKGGKAPVREIGIDPNHKKVTERNPELTAAAQKVASGEMTRDEYWRMADKIKPVKPYDFVPKPASAERVTGALKEPQRERYGTGSIPEGRKVGLRLDIPAYSNHGVWVNSVHDEEDKGKAYYEPVSHITDAVFDRFENKALNVAAGVAKAPFARITGNWKPIHQDDAVERAQEYLAHPEWRQVGMDPTRRGHFYDRESMQPIHSAEEVIQIGPLVLAKKPVYGKLDDYSYAKGGEIK